MHATVHPETPRLDAATRDQRVCTIRSHQRLPVKVSISDTVRGQAHPNYRKVSQVLEGKIDEDREVQNSPIGLIGAVISDASRSLCKTLSTLSRIQRPSRS